MAHDHNQSQIETDIEKHWQQFRAQVIPAEAHQIQVEAMRVSFLAGALVVMNTVASVGDNVTDAERGADMLEALDESIRKANALVYTAALASQRKQPN